jgi:DNA-binding XRE family transcriptional regulator
LSTNTLGQAVKHRRNVLKMSQMELAAQIDGTQKTVSLIEADKRLPEFNTIIRLAKALKGSITIQPNGDIEIIGDAVGI